MLLSNLVEIAEMQDFQGKIFTDISSMGNSLRATISYVWQFPHMWQYSFTLVKRRRKALIVDYIDAHGWSSADDDDDEFNNESSNVNTGDSSNTNNKKPGEDPPPVVRINAFCRLPVYEGKLPIALSRKHLEYHVGTCCSEDCDEEKFVKLALRTCRIACIAADLYRGRPITPAMAKLLTPQCATKLTNAWKLMEGYFKEKNDSEACSMLRRMPAIPNLINGMLVNPHHFEGVVCIDIGNTCHWASLALELKYGNWICTYADLG